MTPIEDVLRYILNHIKRGPETVVPAEESLGLVLAEDIRARDDIPPFTNSAMDGYAVRADETRGASRRRPVALALAEILPAGKIPSKRLVSGRAAKIMTGAPIPRGADAVLPVENAREHDASVLCLSEVRAGDNIRRRGEDVRKGQKILSRGTRIRPQEMGMLGAVGMRRVRVFARPRVAILATGNELVDPARRPGPGRIRNCNSLSLMGLVRKYGAEPVDVGLVRDDEDELRVKILGAARHDMIVASGGVSVGEYDLVKAVLSGIGTEVRSWQVRMKPGKPLAFGLVKGTPFFGLPGNPVSVMVSFEQFVRPALLTMMGRAELAKPVITAVLEEGVEGAGNRIHLVRAAVRWGNGGYLTRPTGPQGSGILASMVAANGLIIVPAGTTMVPAGEKVRVMMLDWNEEGPA